MLGEDQLAASPGFKFDGTCADDPTVTDDFLFLDAWERGLLPSLSAFLRARQIRRANAARAVGLTIVGGHAVEPPQFIAGTHDASVRRSGSCAGGSKL